VGGRKARIRTYAGAHATCETGNSLSLPNLPLTPLPKKNKKTASDCPIGLRSVPGRKAARKLGITSNKKGVGSVLRNIRGVCYVFGGTLGIMEVGG
jgi:hypothetical protein